MKIIKGDLIMTKDMVFDEDLRVEGDICGKDGTRWDITARNINVRNINAWDINAGDINARNINVRNINAWDITAWDINANDINAEDISACDIIARDINARDIDARNITTNDINAGDINFYAVCIAYNTFKCKSWKTNKYNHIIKCLDGEIEIKDDKKYCDKCGSELK